MNYLRRCRAKKESGLGSRSSTGDSGFCRIVLGFLSGDALIIVRNRVELPTLPYFAEHLNGETLELGEQLFGLKQWLV